MTALLASFQGRRRGTGVTEVPSRTRWVATAIRQCHPRVVGGGFGLTLIDDVVLEEDAIPARLLRQFGQLGHRAWVTSVSSRGFTPRA
ncbi:MAG: hypothetical protein WAL64_03905 [Candidatus Dormiibacterota bacterium]